MNYGCKNGLPHQFETYVAPDGTVCDFSQTLYEICVLCGKRVEWNKNKRTGRVDSKEYLEAHIREFCQPYGRTGRVWEILYGDPTKYKMTTKGTNR